MVSDQVLRQLEGDGIIQRDPRNVYRTTRRWQGAMARASLQLYRVNEQSADLRVPIVCALLDLYGSDQPAERIADLTEAMLPIETMELDPHPEQPLTH